MRTFLALLLLSCSLLLSAQDSTLYVTLLDVPSSQGEVLVALYDEPSCWNKPLLAKYIRKAPARAGRMTLEFAHLAPGTYAIAALHDADWSGDMTTNVVGIPKEAYGFANDARGMFGPPSFGESTIVFDGRGKTKIQLK